MSATADPLSSWNDTATRRAIVEFVETVAGAVGEGFVPPAEPDVFVAGTERAVDEVKAQGWTAVSINHDWATVFSRANS